MKAAPFALYGASCGAPLGVLLGVMMGVMMGVLGCTPARAQVVVARPSVLDPIPLPGRGAPMNAPKPPGEARAFGTDGQSLPGTRVAAASDIVGKWNYVETRNNVEIKGVRVPVRTANLTLELRADGTYTLNYEVYWGLGNDDPKGQQAGLIVNETGKYAVSGSILLLEAEPLEAIEQGRFERTTRRVPAEKRAYIARIQGYGLNLAGRCAAYQIEEVCTRSRSVWLPLIKPQRRPSLRIG